MSGTTGTTSQTSPERRLIEDVRSGARSAEACTQQALQALQDSGRLNLLVGEPLQEALGHARAIDRACDAGRPPGVLAGLPVVVKDNIAVAGLPLTAGSPALRGHRPTRSAGSVTRLVDAGAVVVGQSNMHELALGVTGDNRAHGPVRNPHDASRTAGGSSGGTAAAVAVGAVLAGLGTDTGGSGRIPAAWCGVAGFRPSAGRYPADGVLNLSRTMDTVAVLTRSLDGLALLDGVLGGGPGARAPAPPELRLGVPGSCWSDVSPDVLAGCEEALARFRAAGVVLVPVDLERAHALDREVNLPLVAHEAVEFWSAFAAEELGCDVLELSLRLASPDVAERLDALRALPRRTSAEYAQLLGTVRQVQDVYRRLFAGMHLDALVFPTVPVTAPALGATTVHVPSGEREVFRTLTVTETPASLAGIPALTVPAGRDSRQLPFGLELDGPAGGDRRLIALAGTLASLLPGVPDGHCVPEP